MFSFLLVHLGSTAVRGQEGEGSRSGRALPDSAECQRVKDVLEIVQHKPGYPKGALVHWKTFSLQKAELLETENIGNDPQAQEMIVSMPGF